MIIVHSIELLLRMEYQISCHPANEDIITKELVLPIMYRNINYHHSYENSVRAIAKCTFLLR